MNDNTRSQELLLLGEIKGIVQGLKDGQDLQTKRIDAMQGTIENMDGRLRNVEQKSAVIGAVSGGAMSIGIALIIEGAKQFLVGRGGN